MGASHGAQLNTPRFLAVASGSLYFTDSGNHRVRKVDLATELSHLCWDWISGKSVMGPSYGGTVQYSSCIAAASGCLYIADVVNNCVRRIDWEMG